MAKMAKFVLDSLKNIVGEGENAGYLFSFSHNAGFLPSFNPPVWTTLWKTAFETILEKRENAGNQHFLI